MERAITLRLIPTLFAIAFWPAAAFANLHYASIPLQDGRLSLQTLQNCLSGELHISNYAWSRIPLNAPLDLRGLSGWTTIRALNAALGDGVHIYADRQSVILEFDPDKLPRDWTQTCDATIRFTETAAPDATARQRARLGLRLPESINPQKPLVILIHGLDGDAGSCAALRDLLTANGQQVAIFAYPAERPLSESSEFLTREMNGLHRTFPGLKIDFVTESMGGLLARQYVEGPAYAGDVQHLILIAPPNQGSTWARLSIFNRLVVNTFKYLHDPQWSPTWMITEGICQAGSDLEPNSDFLQGLNSLARRPGVKYTIVAGDQPVTNRITGQVLSAIADALPRNIWGISVVHDFTQRAADDLLNSPGAGDGPVSLNSAALAGVDDFVVVHADHNSLYESVDGRIPAAWPVIRDRLAN
jgi:hypothetical protein